MQLFKQNIVLFTLLLLSGACQSQEAVPVDPIPVSILPKTLFVESYNQKNPTTYAYTWQGETLISFSETTLNTTTNKDFVLTYDITRNAKSLVQSIKYSYKGANYADGSQIWDYSYSTDGLQIRNSGNNTWTYNSVGNLLSLDYGTGTINNLLSLQYNSANLLTKLLWKEGSYLDKTNTLGEFTTIENPLYILAKKTQFLNMPYNDAVITLACSMLIPKSYNNGAIDNFVTYDLDAQHRINAITIKNNGIVLKKFTFGY
jgi:hypothetical protein